MGDFNDAIKGEEKKKGEMGFAGGRCMNTLILWIFVTYWTLYSLGQFLLEPIKGTFQG